MAATWLFFCALAYAMTDMRKFNEALDKINEREDQNSVEITDDNYLEVVYSDDDKFILFCHPQIAKCKMQGAEWGFFGKKKDSFSTPVVLGKVDVGKYRKAANLLGVRDVPAIVYISQGYFYNYTGRAEPKGLTKAIDQQLFLQHDRKILPPKPDTPIYYIYYAYRLLRKAFFEYTVVVTGLFAVAIYVVLSRATIKAKLD